MQICIYMKAATSIIDTMAGRPRLGLGHTNLGLWKKTWLILNELEFKGIQADKKKKKVEIVHEAVVEYADRHFPNSKVEKNGRGKK